MKKQLGYFGAFLLGCGATAFIAATPLQDHGHTHDKGGHDHDHAMPSDEEMMKMFGEAMDKYGNPAEQHERFAKIEGTWNVDSKFWHYPGAEAETGTAKAEFKVILDGRFLKQHFNMDWNGMPFEGYGLTAYDRLSKKWQSTWIDNMSTSLHYSEGTKSGNTITLHGKMADIFEGKMTDARMTEELVDKNTMVFRHYKPGPDGSEFKAMELKYTRN